jgi:hypothetical protein
MGLVDRRSMGCQYIWATWAVWTLGLICFDDERIEKENKQERASNNYQKTSLRLYPFFLHTSLFLPKFPICSSLILLFQFM